VRSILLDLGYSTKLDATREAIGRRYARTDEIGIPFGVTVDTQSEVDRTITLRERDSCAQVCVSVCVHCIYCMPHKRGARARRCA
jgi:glycyl-tRNA synthetase